MKYKIYKDQKEHYHVKWFDWEIFRFENNHFEFATMDEVSILLKKVYYRGDIIVLSDSITSFDRARITGNYQVKGYPTIDDKVKS